MNLDSTRMRIYLKQFKLIYASTALFSFIFICTFTLLQKKQFSSKNSNSKSIYNISNQLQVLDSPFDFNIATIKFVPEIISTINTNDMDITSSDILHWKWDPRIDVIVFIHIQKTGGTFFEKELDQLLIEDGNIIDINNDSNAKLPISSSTTEKFYKPACSCVFIFARCKCDIGNGFIWHYVP